jgi:hypothetical protein
MVVLSDPGIAADVSANVQDGSVSYSGALTILEDAAAGGMTASKLSSLQAFASELNVAGGISTSSYVQQITDDVVFENSANSTWNRGAATATPLGDLSSTSTQAQVDELIGEWFLGTNLPSLNLASVGGDTLSAAYQNSTLPLYGPTGAPTIEDVNQGNLGDCYFLSSLGEIALRDPAAIESMISSNGNGTYSVRFFVDGQPDYVTVNSELPVMNGLEWANGSTLEFANGTTDDWVALIEKAYAELNAQTNAPHGATLDSPSDSYAGLTAGDGSALTLITDQSETLTGLGPWDSSSSLTSLMSSLAASWNAGQDILVSTPANSSGNLVGAHMFMVTAIDASACALTVQNPWGSAYSGPLAMDFTDTLQELADDDCTLWVTSGDPGVTPTPTRIATNGATTLAQVGVLFELNPAGGGTGPFLKVNGSAVTAGQFAAGWTPVGAVQTATGYEVAWRIPGANEYEVWDTDGNGDYTSAATGILSAASAELEGLEANFGETFAGAGAKAAPTTIATNGATTLAEVGNLFELNPPGGGTGPLLQLNGSVVTAGEFAAGWTPVGAMQTASGYEVAWSVAGKNEYVVWDVNSSGDYTSPGTAILSGTSDALQQVELNFGETFRGAEAPTPSIIATNGVTTLARVANEFELNPASGGTGPFLEIDGSPVMAGQFPLGWAPVGAVQTSSGYEVAWSVAGQDEYVVWDVNSSGAYTSAATGILTGAEASPELEGLEANFGETFPGAGTKATPTTIAANGATTLAVVGNLFELNPAAGGRGPLLQLDGSLVTAGQFALPWTPVGAVKTASGYEVAWSVPGQNEYVVWDVNSAGAYTSTATGILSGASPELEGVEANFRESFAGAGAEATPTPVSTNGATTLAEVGNLFELNPAGGGTGPLLQLNGSLVTAGEFPLGWTPTGAEKTSSGYEVTWSLPGQDEYTVWDVNSSGEFTGDSTGIVSSESTPLEGLTPSSGEDLNDDGKLSAPAGSLEAYDIIVGGAHASAFASIADPAHGAAPTRLSSSLTAADLWSAHTTSSGGHALTT